MNTHSSPRTEAELRAERLAKNLRENLKRRKMQARERKNTESIASTQETTRSDIPNDSQ